MPDGNTSAEVLNQTAQSQLRSIVERVERLEREKAEVAAQIKEVLAEAKASGFDTKIVRKVVKVRAMDRAKRQEEEALTDLYLSAIGELPLFEERVAAEHGPSGITSITLTSDRGSVTAPPEVVRQALSQVKDDDSLYAEALELVRQSGNASVSHIQRHLQIGYNRAASFIERMEREQVVGPANHAGKRDLLRQAAA